MSRVVLVMRLRRVGRASDVIDDFRASVQLLADCEWSVRSKSFASEYNSCSLGGSRCDDVTSCSSNGMASWRVNEIPALLLRSNLFLSPTPDTFDSGAREEVTSAGLSGVLRLNLTSAFAPRFENLESLLFSDATTKPNALQTQYPQHFRDVIISHDVQVVVRASLRELSSLSLDKVE